MIEITSLRPPEPHFTPELEWVLDAAFAADRALPESGFAPRSAWALARDLALTERIGAQCDSSELPVELRAGFRRAQARAAAVGLFYERTAREVATVAAGIGAPIVFLKGLALVLAGTVPEGGRPFSDLDVLVPEARADELFEALTSRDFAASPAEATEQHLPELRPARGGSLEVHFALRGVEFAPNQPAALEDLADRTVLIPLESFPGAAYVPTPALLAAHILAHGFQQHLLRPATYPLFRMISDLLDLVPDRKAWGELRGEWLPAIGHAVSARSFEATRSLCETLRAGERPEPRVQADATVLFYHLLAGALDRGYGESLRGAYLRDRLHEAYRRREIGDYLKRKIRPLWGVKRS